MKECRVCHSLKDLTEFYNKPSSRDGVDTICKVCYKARRNAQAAENRKNPDYISKRNLQSQQCKQRKYTYDEDYRETEKKRSRDWHREKYNIDVEYREAEKERNRNKCNLAYTTDQEYRMKQIARQHERRLAPGSYTYEQWIESLDYFEYQCAYCGETTNLTVEHIIPVSNQGTNYIFNIIPACSHCNTSKGAKDVLEWYTIQPFYSEYRLRKIHTYFIEMQKYLALEVKNPHGK